MHDFDALARDWYGAWNAHDLDAIISHYNPDVVFTSPFVARLTGDDEGTLRGTDALRDYFATALERFPDLRFEPLTLLTGVSSAVLHYRSVENLIAAETVEVGADGRVVRVLAHYSPA